MSFSERLSNLKNTYQDRLSDSIKQVVYKGNRFIGVCKKENIEGQPLAFNESSGDGLSIKWLFADCSEKPNYGDKIIIGNDFYLVRSASLDSSGVWWSCEVGSYYNSYAEVYNNYSDADSSTVYQAVRCRLLDPEMEDFTQFEGADLGKARQVVVIREDSWAADEFPKVGYVVKVDAGEALRVVSVENYGGDIRLICRGI